MKHMKGFTLLEIMIALVIGLFLSAGVIKIFINTSTNNRMQENLSRMQENARFAMHFIAEDIQRTNFFGGECLRSAGSIRNHLDASSAEYNPALHSFTLIDTSGAPASIKNAIDGTAGTVDAANSAFDNPDSVTLRAFFDKNPSSLSAAMTSEPAFVAATANSGFRGDDIVLITDCTFADIFQVTDASAAINDQLVHEDGHAGAASSAIPGNSGTADPVELQQAYPKRSFIYRLSNGTNSTMERTYSIGLSGPDNIPSLMRSNGGAANALVGDIENMQLVYGVNSDSSTASVSTPNYYQADITALTDDERENIVSIRVSLLIRSPDDNLVNAGQAYIYNGGNVTGASIPDGRLRKVYTSTIAVRNRPPVQ